MQRRLVSGAAAAGWLRQGGREWRRALVLRWALLASSLVGCLTLQAATTGVVLPAQANRTINELTTLVVTNTATDSNSPPGGPVTAATNTITFTYASRSALLADGWNFIATNPDGTPRNTEITDSAAGALVSYDQTQHPGSLRIPCDVGDLWGNRNNSRNSLFRALPTNWVSVQLAMAFRPTVDFQQVHLTYYQDDDNFVQAGFAFNDSLGGTVSTLIWEVAQVPYHYYAAIGPQTGIHLRLDRSLSTGNVTGFYSLNGTNWNVIGANNSPLNNPRLCIWVGGSTNSFPNCDLQRLDLISSNSSPSLTVTYQLAAAPAGASIDANGIITWTPAEGQGPSTNVFTTIATDNASPPSSATNSFSVVVNEINLPPVLPLQTNRTLASTASLVVTNTATDADLPAESLTYQLTVAPANAVIDTRGVITWTPPPDQVPSTNTFTTVVTDYNPAAANAQHLSATNSFIVTVLAPGYPILPEQVTQVLNWPGTLLVTNRASDGGVVAQLTTNTFKFTYTNRSALQADGWSFFATTPGGAQRNTEVTSGAVVSYDQTSHPGVLRIPCDRGDLWSTANNTTNMLCRALPAKWLSVRLSLAFGPLSANYQQAHLTYYQDDDNFTQVGLAYSSLRNGSAMTMDLETGGNPNAFATAATSATNLRFRLDSNPSNGAVTGMYSVDGVNWLTLGTTNQGFVNPRLAIWTGGEPSAYTTGMPTLDLSQLDIIASNFVPVTVTYALLNAPAGATIDADGVISWTPSASQAAGSYWFQTVATDNAVPPASATNSFWVTVKGALAVTLDSQTRAYGQDNPSLTATVTGLQNGDNITATGTTAATAGSPVGSYPILPVLNDPDKRLAYYNVVTNSGTLTVTQAVLAITATGVNKVYDGTTTAAVLLADNRLPGDALTTSYTNAVFVGRNVGNGLAVTVSGLGASGPAASNYVLASSQTTTMANIQPRPITVTATADTRAYDGTTQSTALPAISSAKLVAGDTAAFVETFDTKDAGTAKTLTPSGLVNDANGGSNYVVSFVSDYSGVITPRALNVSATAQDKVYDGTTLATLSLSDNRLGTDVLSASYTNAAFADASAGKAKVVYVSGIALSGADATNYTANATASTTANITPAPLTIAAEDQSRRYGTANPPFTSTFAGFVNGETTNVLEGTLRLATLATPASPAGTYAIVPSGLTATNYSITFSNGTLLVTGAPLLVSADNQWRAYGATNPPLTAIYSGFVNGDGTNVLSGSPVLTTSAETNSPVGSYPIEVSLGTLSNSNYSFEFTNASTLTVTGAVLTVTAANQSRLFSAPDPLLSASMSGFVNGETEAAVVRGVPSLSSEAATNSHVGTYPIHVAQGSLQATNYTFVFVDGTLSITLAASVLDLAASVNPVAFGSNVTFRATLRPVAPATATPATLVQFFTNGVPAGSPQELVGDSMMFDTAQLPAGTNTVMAVFLGDENFAGCTNSLLEIVAQVVQSPEQLAIADNHDGAVSVTFTGTPGAAYWLQAAAGSTPLSWTTISTNVPDSAGHATFTDVTTNTASRFYRVAKP
jgi:hypothetical protein